MQCSLKFAKIKRHEYLVITIWEKKLQRVSNVKWRVVFLSGDNTADFSFLSFQDLLNTLQWSLLLSKEKLYRIYKSILIYDVCAKFLQSCPALGDPMDCSLQAPLSMGFSRQEYWSGLAIAFCRDLPDPGTEPAFLEAIAGRFFTAETPVMPY